MIWSRRFLGGWGVVRMLARLVRSDLRALLVVFSFRSCSIDGIEQLWGVENTRQIL